MTSTAKQRREEMIDLMPIDRRMDALIAERVMGFRVVHDSDRDHYLCNDPEQVEIGGHTKSYSTNLSAAWLVIKKLSSHPKYCGKVTLEVIVPGPVRVRIESPGSDVVEGWGRTPAEAICRAALKAVMDS